MKIILLFLTLATAASFSRTILLRPSIADRVILRASKTPKTTKTARKQAKSMSKPSEISQIRQMTNWNSHPWQRVSNVNPFLF